MCNALCRANSMEAIFFFGCGAHFKWCKTCLNARSFLSTFTALTIVVSILCVCVCVYNVHCITLHSVFLVVHLPHFSQIGYNFLLSIDVYCIYVIIIVLFCLRLECNISVCRGCEQNGWSKILKLCSFGLNGCTNKHIVSIVAGTRSWNEFTRKWPQALSIQYKIRWVRRTQLCLLSIVVIFKGMKRNEWSMQYCLPQRARMLSVLCL